MITGRAVIDRITKRLVKRIKPHEIAVINHRDLDQVAGQSLVDKNVGAVINLDKSISGKYPNRGPSVLLDSGIPIIDSCGSRLTGRIEEGDLLTIKNDRIYHRGNIIGRGKRLTPDYIEKQLEKARENLNKELERFIDNTLTYARREKDLIINIPVPDIGLDFSGQHTLVVVRGKNHREDLNAVSSYIREVNPVILAVDGGADACLDMGYTPDVIIGDMDSVSAEGLKCGARLVVHAYPSGKAPGMKRINRLGLEATLFPAPGTSEDIAMLLAYEKKAELITAVGTHTNMIDFLAKGREGMASTMLVRLKIGDKLVDARGVSKLYENRIYNYYWLQILLAIILPMSVLGIFSPPLKHFLHLLALKLELILNY